MSMTTTGRDFPMAYVGGYFHSNHDTDDETSVFSSGVSLYGDRCLESSVAGSVMEYSEDDVSQDGGNHAFRGKSVLFNRSFSSDGESVTSDESSLFLTDRYFDATPPTKATTTTAATQASEVVPHPKQDSDDSTIGSEDFSRTPLRALKTNEDWSHFNEKRGRSLAQTLLRSVRDSSPKRPRKSRFLQRAVRYIRKKDREPDPLDRVKSMYSTSLLDDEDENRDANVMLDPSPFESSEAQHHSYPTDEESGEEEDVGLNNVEMDPLRSLDEIAETMSQVSDQFVEVWQIHSSSSSMSESDELLSAALMGLSNHLSSSSVTTVPMVSTPNSAHIPDALASRASSEEVIYKLKLGQDGWDALQALEEAASAASEAFDPCQGCSNGPATVPMMEIVGQLVPDYDSYVRQAVLNFRRDILKMSDETFASMQNHLAKNRRTASTM